MKTILELQALATRIRIGTIEEFQALGFGHIGGSLSVCDALSVLYGDIMRYRADEPSWQERDKLVCSKGHAGPAVYATLALMGFFPYQDILTLNKPGTRFPSHCDRNKTLGVDMTTGSLGQGASQAVGLALGDRLKGRDNRVFLIVGDGELNEGQVWEAAMFAAAKKLGNMVWLIDFNKKQLDGTVHEILEPFSIEQKFKAFGFDAVTVNGQDVGAIRDALLDYDYKGERPHAIVLDGIKGAGVPDVENTVLNHSMNVTHETCDRWLAELKHKLAELEGGEQA